MYVPSITTAPWILVCVTDDPPCLYVPSLSLCFFLPSSPSESANKERIQKAHRKLLMLNHPDTGGSPLIATKINEAKETLLGGKG